MKKYVIGIVVVIGIFLSGMLVQYVGMNSTDSVNDQKIKNATSKKPLYWVAPMDPTYRRDKPGKSPMGMDLVPVYAETDSEGAVKISPTVEQNLGVRTEKVTRQTLSRQIDTVGYVMVDENRIEHVHTYTDGWVKRLLVKTTGEHVNKGQLLFELYAPILINAQEEYLLAMRSGNKALTNASHKKLLALGVAESQIQELKKTKKSMQLVKFFAGQAGIVSELKIREGMFVKPEKDLITLEDLSHIWVIGEVFERQSGWVKEGQPAEASLPYLPGKKWVGVVDYVYPRLDPTTHTLKIRLRFDNPKEVLKPNMYADITIFAVPEKDVLAIPREAVIYTGKGARVIVSLGDGRYVAKPIKLGIESGNKIVVLSGLKEDEKIVTSSQFLIDSESSLKASFGRINSENTKPKDQHQHH